MIPRNVLVDGARVVVYKDGFKGESRETAPGWDLGWIYENVYGWLWFGPFRWDGQVHLVVLPHEPGQEERATIEARLATAPTPDGGPRLRDPFSPSEVHP